MYQILKKLIAIPSLSGREELVLGAVAEQILPYVDECHTDAMGNLIAVKKGSEGGRRVVLCAHMDEIGFLVTHVSDKGQLRVAPMGGVDWCAAAFSRVLFENGTVGVLVPEENTKPEDYKADKFYIDIGATTKREAERRVHIGDGAVFAPEVLRLMGSRIAGRPLDDKLGCAVLLDIARKMTAPSADVYFVFSVQEEVGCRGAGPAVFDIAPDYALVFDVTGTGDVPGAKPMAVSVGKGAAIKVKDSSVICHSQVVEQLTRLAGGRGISHQLEILTYGGTDTSAIQISGHGTQVGALSIPSRYIHTGVELADMKDAEACRDLALAFIETV